MAMETQREVAEYFRSLELALNEQEKKGTPKGDPTYSRIYTQLARDISQIGIARDELREAPFSQSSPRVTALSDRIESTSLVTRIAWMRIFIWASKKIISLHQRIG